MFKDRHKSSLFFAHNLSYDLGNLDYPEGSAVLLPGGTGKLIGATYGYGVQSLSKKGEIKHQYNYKFLDTGNFFVGASVDSLGEVLGYPKIEYDVLKLRKKHPDDLSAEEKAEVSKYCMRDAEIVYKTALKLQDLAVQHNVSLKAFTSASLAMHIFRRNFLQQRITQRSQVLNDIERLAYYGGRTEVFDYNKHEKVFYSDINSSYPTAMLNHEFPYPSNFEIMRGLEWEDIKPYFGISLIRIHVPKMHIPPLPFRQVYPECKLLFPTGTWTAAYTHEELKMAERHGAKVLKVYESIIYATKFKPFADYVSTFHKKKNTSKGIERDFYKLLLNGLSGKFGEKRNEVIRDKIENITIKDLDEFFFDNPDKNGWVTGIGKRLPDPNHSFPVLVAYICSYARIKLYEDALCKGSCIYCDTDSAVATEDIVTNKGEQLGEWKTDVFNGFQAYCPKFYEPGTDKDGKRKQTRLKGIPRKAKQVIEDGMIYYVFDRPLKLAEAIRQKKPPNSWHTIKKLVSYADTKRDKQDDLTSKPIHINEPDCIETFEELLKITQKYL